MEDVAIPRLLLADDHESVLVRLSSLLREFDVVGTARNGKEAVAEVQRLDPDVLVIDISMPVLNGLQAASQLQAMHCRTKVVFLTIHEDKDFAAAAFAAGASGYVVKSRMSSDLIPAVRDVLQGHQYISQSIPPFCKS